jgi:hypothetical protein
MNKTRIIALALLFIGIAIQFTLENDTIDLISGILVGGGIGLLFSGKKPKILD